MTDARMQVSHSLLLMIASPLFRVLLACEHLLAQIAPQAYQQVYAWSEADPAFEAAAKENIDMFCFETTLKVNKQKVQRAICRLVPAASLSAAIRNQDSCS